MHNISRTRIVDQRILIFQVFWAHIGLFLWRAYVHLCFHWTKITTYLPSLDPINISLDIIFLNLGVAFCDLYFLKLVKMCFTT